MESFKKPTIYKDVPTIATDSSEIQDDAYNLVRPYLDRIDKLLAENAELKKQLDHEQNFHMESVADMNKTIKDLEAEVERLSDALGGLLCHATGSLLSYSTYPKQTMYDAVDDYIEQRIDEVLERME